MVDPEKYIKDGLVIAKKLMKEGSLQTAYSACQELLKVNPYHKKIISLAEEIQECIVEANKKKVDSDIDATMHLWDEKRYDELQRIYVRLYQFAPTFKRLQKLIQKLNQYVSDDQKSQRSEFLKKALSAIRDLHDKGEFTDAMQACNELLSLDPMNDDARDALAKARKALVTKKLQENERITDSADFERQLEFYESLLAIDPGNASIARLASNAKAGLSERKVLAAKVELNLSIARMKVLFDHAEYEKVLQACDEIEQMSPRNFSALLFRKKTKNAIDEEIERQSVAKLRETWKNMLPEYQKNPEVYLRV